MDDRELRAFVDIVQHYFAQTTQRAVEVGSPYLGDPGTLPVLDYTGVIGVSGARRGCVYFTAPAELLRALLLRIGESDLSESNLADLAGEVANTLSGNARRTFGHDFGISVPIVIRGAAQSIKVPREIKAYVIPLRWQREDAALVVSLT